MAARIEQPAIYNNAEAKLARKTRLHHPVLCDSRFVNSQNVNSFWPPIAPPTLLLVEVMETNVCIVTFDAAAILPTTACSRYS